MYKHAKSRNDLGLLVILVLVVTTFKELALDICPQLAFVVVGVPGVDCRVKISLESEGAGKNGGHVNRISLVKERKLLLAIQSLRTRAHHCDQDNKNGVI